MNRICGVAFLLFSNFVILRGDQYYVNAATGSNTSGNGSLANPWKTVTYALDQISGTGHTLNVAAGTYNSSLGETFPILMKNGVSIVGTDANLCILDAAGTNTVIRCVGITDGTTKIEGLTIKGGGNVTQGGGLFISAGSVLLVTKCRIVSNMLGSDVESGGGIYVANASPVILNDTISANKSGGIYVNNGSPLIKGNSIVSNQGVNASGIFVTGASSIPRIVGNIIAKNSSSVSTMYGISCSASSHARIINNTISDNVGGIFIDGASPDSIENNIIAFNSNYGILENTFSSDPGRVGYNLFFQNGAGLYRDENTTDYFAASALNGTVPECSANLDGDPKFNDRTNNDYHLRAGSAAFDAGNPNTALNDPDGTRGDIGALFFDVPPSVPANVSAIRGNAKVQLIWRSNPELDVVRYRVYYGTSPVPTTKMDSTSSATDTSRTYPLSNNTTYYFRVTAVDAAGNASGYSTEVSATPVAVAGGEYLPDANTVLLMHMNETGGSSVRDTSGNSNHGTASGTSIADGRFAKARQFNGSSDVINTPYTGNLGTGPLTVEFWVKPATLAPGHQNVIGNRHPQGPNTWWIGIFNDGRINYDGGSGPLTSNNGDIETGKWNHVAVTRDASNKSTIYKNGVAIATGSQTGDFSGGTNLALGAIYSGGEYFAGVLDEVRISNTARLPAEFNILLPPKNVLASVSGTNITVTWQNAGGLAPFLKFRIYRGTDSTNISLIDSTTLTSITHSGLGTGTRFFYRVAAVDSFGYEYARSFAAQAVTATALGEYSPDANTVLLLHMNEPSGSAVTDASASSNNGSANGTTLVSGRTGKARSYSSSGDQINIPHSTTLNFGTGPFTLEAWVNTLGYSFDAHPFHKRGSPNNRGWWTSINSDGSISISVCNVSDQFNSGMGSRSKINDGGWHHIAYVVTQTLMTIYIDGVQDNIGTVWMAGSPDNDGMLNIGSSWNNFRGLLDEIRISNKARTPNEFNLQLPPKQCTASASSNAIALTWQQGGGLTPLMRYRIYRGTDSVNVSRLDSTTASSYLDLSAVPGTFYFYRIAAVDSTGFESARSIALCSEVLLVGEYQVDTSTVFLMHLNQTGGINVGDVGRNAYHGQFNGGSFVAGRFGNAFQPTSSAGVWTQSFSTVGMENQFTAEAWIKLTGQPTCNGCTFLGLPWMNFNMNPDLYYWFNYTLSDWSGRGLWSPGNIPLTIGKWCHVAFVFNAGEASLFLNGVLVSKDSPGQSLKTGSGNISFAGYNPPDVFPGLIDEVRISKIARNPNEFGLQLQPVNVSAKQIGPNVRLEWLNGGGAVPCMRYRIYRGTDSLSVSVIDSTTSLSCDDTKAVAGISYVYRVTAVDSTGFESAMSRPVAYSRPLLGEYQVDSTTVFLMHMNAASGTIVTDLGPSRLNGQTNSGTFVSGRFGSAYLPGNTNGMQLQNIPSVGLENKLTLEAWIKLSQAPRAHSRILQIPNIEITINSDYWLNFSFRLDDGTWTGVGTSLNSRYLGKWIQIAATYDNGIASLYVNGVRRTSWSFGQSLMTGWGGGCIGQSDGGQIFTGAIDEMRISNVVRQPNEFGLQLPPKDMMLTRTISAVHLQWQNGGGTIPLMRYKIYRGTDSLNVSVIDSTDGLSYEDSEISAGRFYCYRISAVDSTGFDNNEGQNVFASIPMVGEYDPDTSTVLLMHLNQPGASVAFDVSDNRYHGWVNSGSFAGGRFGMAYRPANTNGISLSTIPSTGLEDHVTMEAWVRLDGSLNDRFDIVSMPDMVFHLNSDYSVSFDFQLADGNWSGVGTNSAQLTVGRWYHVACTYDNGIASVFVDGVRRGTNTPGQSLKTATGGGSLARMYSESSFSGLIDEVRISKVARQPGEFGFQFPPKGLTATVSNSNVHVSWQNGGGGAPLMRYRVYKGADSLNVLSIDSTIATSYDDKNIVAGKTYCYRVSAVDSSGFEISKGNSVYAIIPLLGEYAVDTATVLLMHFDQDSGAVAGDVGPNGYRGQVNGGSFVSGRFGKAFQPSNTNGISVSNLPSVGLENQLTIEAWVKLVSTPTDWCNIVGFPHMNLGSNTDLSVGIGLTLEDGRAGGAGTSSYVLAVGKWYHVAGTFENGTSKIYVNGVLLGSYTSGQSLRTGSGGGSIATSNNNNVFPGLVDEVRILRRALRPEQFGLQLPPTSLTASQSGNTVHLEWKNGGGGIPCMRYRIYRGADSLNISVLDSTTNLVYDDSKTTVGSSYVYRIAAVDSTGFENSPSFAASIAIPLAGEYRADTTTVLLMHLNQLGGSIVTDVGPYGYHGLVSSGTCVDGRFGKAYLPANTNGIWLRNISTASTGGQITVEAWIKPSGLPNNWSGIIAISWINIHLNTDLSASMDLGFTDGTGGGIGTSSNALKVGKWHHVAGTYDNAVAKIYVDGVLQSSRFFGQTLGTGPGSGSIATSNGNNTFPGLIDEIRISRVAFQPTQFGLQLPPANLSAAQGGGNIRLEWTNGGGGIPCMKYRIYRGADSANVSTIDSTTNLLYNDATAQAGKFYFYRVASVDSTGFEGAKSYAVHAVVPFPGEYRPDTSTVVLMHMDQDSGLGVYDASTNNYHGQMSAGSFVPGRFGNAFKPGSFDGMWFNSISSVGMEKQFTIELWVKFTDIKKFWSQIISIPWMYMVINQDFSFNLNFCLEDGSWGGAWSPSFVMSVGKWYHLAGVFDHGTSKIYVNGVAYDSRYYDQSVRTSPGGGNVAYYNNPDVLPALIDEVRISKVARRPDEFGLQLPPTNLSATIQATSIRLNWQNGGGAIPCMRYNIYRGIDSLNVLLMDSTAKLSYDDTTAVRGIFYIYRVAAIDSTGFEGARSSALTATLTTLGEYQPDTSTVLLLHLNGTGATTAYDASRYGNHGRLDKTTSVAGRFGNAKRFDDQSYIHIPHSASVDIGDGDFTLEAWVNAPRRSDWGGIIWKTGSINGFDFYINGNDGQLRMDLWDGTTSRGVASSTRVDDSKWHHVAATRRNAIVSLYVDGALDGTTDISALGSLANFGEITLQRGTHVIDEVRISNRARSPEEFDLQLPPKNLRVAVSGSNVNLTWEQGGGVVPLSKYKIYRGFDPNSLTLCDSTASTSYQDGGLLAGAKYYYRVTAVDSTGFESAKSSPASLIHSVVLGEYVPDSTTVLLLHMDEQSGSNVGDASSSNNDGKATGTTVVAGRFGKARSFNGKSFTENGITVPSSSSFNFGTGSFTLEAWIYMFGQGDNNAVAIQKRGNPNNRGWYMYFTGNLQLGSCVLNTSDQNGTNITGTHSLNDGKWHHLAMVVTQLKLSSYIDGVLENESAISSQGTPDNDGALTIGDWFKGVFDEIRISKKARTPQEFNLQLRPLNLTAGIAATSISLSWQAGGGGCPLLRYRVYRGSDSTSMAAIDSTVATSYVNAGLTVGTKYYYRIAAVDSTGFESVKSFATSATTQSIPSAPSGLTAAAVSYSKVNLSWTDNSNNEDGFKIERKTGSGGTYAQLATVGSNVKTYQDTGLTALTQYYYRVSAYNGAGTSSPNETNVTTPIQPDLTAPASPISPSIASAGWTSASAYTISWTNPTDASGIAKVWYRYDRPPTTDTLGTSLTFTVASGVASVSVPAPATCGAHPLYFYLEDGVTPTGNKNPASCVSVVAKHDDLPPVIVHDSLSVVSFTVSTPQDISIPATATDAHSGVKSLQLQYKKAGTSWTSPHTVNYAPAGGSAAIRALDIATYSIAGVDYRIVCTDTANNVSTSSTHSLLIQYTRTYARVDASGNSITQMSVTQLPSNVSSQMAYRMFSVPLKLNDETPRRVLEKETGLPVYDNSEWRFFRLNANNGYDEYPSFADESVIKPGAAFFLIINSGRSPMAGTGAVVKAEDINKTGISLRAGYNFVGNPFNFDVSIDSSLSLSGTESLTNRTWEFVGVGGTNSGWKPNPSVLKPWEGIVVKLTAAAVLRFNIVDGPRSGISDNVIASKSKESDDEKDGLQTWRLRVVATREDNGIVDSENLFGVEPSATDTADLLDLFEPPMIGDKGLSLASQCNEEWLTHDFRKARSEGYVWDLRLRTSDRGARVRLDIEGTASLPTEVYLIDLDSKIAYRAKTLPRIDVNSGNGSRRFRLIVGSINFAEQNSLGVQVIPREFALLQNYPNPFNPVTMIRYTLPNSEKTYRVSLKIYNLLGNEIASLVETDQSAGYYEVRFDGSGISTGTYFYRIEVNGGTKETTFRDVKKLMLIK